MKSLKEIIYIHLLKKRAGIVIGLLVILFSSNPLMASRADTRRGNFFITKIKEDHQTCWQIWADEDIFERYYGKYLEDKSESIPNYLFYFPRLSKSIKKNNVLRLNRFRKNETKYTEYNRLLYFKITYLRHETDRKQTGPIDQELFLSGKTIVKVDFFRNVIFNPVRVYHHGDFPNGKELRLPVSNDLRDFYDKINDKTQDSADIDLRKNKIFDSVEMDLSKICINREMVITDVTILDKKEENKYSKNKDPSSLDESN